MAISDEYKENMRLEHDGSNWGTTAVKYAGDLIVGALTSRKYITKVLDFGCGKGVLKPYIEQHCPWVTVYEYDPGIPGKDTLPTDTFDAIVSSDVLEHVEPSKLDETLIWMSEHVKYALIHDIACSPTFKLIATGPYKGQDLHLIVEEPKWWRAKFKEVLPELHEAEYAHREKSSHKGPRPRCWLIYEVV